MKKLLLMIAFVMATVCANAQIMRLDELEKYAIEKYGGERTLDGYVEWTEAAEKISKNVELDKIEEAAKHGLVGNENDNW